MARATRTRFRYNAALAVAAIIALIGTLPMIKASAWFALLLLIPAAVAAWGWRAGTDVDPDGLRVRALLGSRYVPWTDVEELGADDRGRAIARLRTGMVLPLPAVSAADLPKVIVAAGQEPPPTETDSETEPSPETEPDRETDPVAATEPRTETEPRRAPGADRSG
jgi:hypothetical protein